MKTKTLLLSLFFTIAVIGLKAQDNEKYEYAYVQYMINMGAGLDGIWMELPGKEMEQIKLELKELKAVKSPLIIWKYAPLMDYLEKLSGEGWQVVSSDLSAGKYFLRRKKQ